jgi:gas vesicle protein
MAEQMDDERGFSFVAFIAGAGIGALLGAAVALLLAPQSGRESREDVKEALHRLSEKTDQLAGRVKEAAAGFVQEKRELLGKAVESYREGAGEKKKEIEKS